MREEIVIENGVIGINAVGVMGYPFNTGQKSDFWQIFYSALSFNSFHVVLIFFKDQRNPIFVPVKMGGRICHSSFQPFPGGSYEAERNYNKGSHGKKIIHEYCAGFWSVFKARQMSNNSRAAIMDMS